MKVEHGEPVLLDRETLATLGAAMEAAAMLSPGNLKAEAAFDCGDMRVSVKLTVAVSGN